MPHDGRSVVRSIRATLLVCTALACATREAHAQRRVDGAAWKPAADGLPSPACLAWAAGTAESASQDCGGTAVHAARIAQDPGRPGFSRSFRNEALGGAFGSAVGLAIGLLIADPEGCDSEDLECLLEKLGIGLAASGVGAAAGTLTAGHLGRSHPSTPGAALGAVAGIPAGIGVTHLLSEEIDVTSNAAVLFLAYSLTHGITTALGSRVGAWLRGGP